MYSLFGHSFYGAALIAFCAAMPALGAEGEFSDKQDRKTVAWVLSALDAFDASEAGDLSAMKRRLAGEYDLKSVERAFSRLQRCRVVEKYHANPPLLVAAEHYAFMRYEAANSGDTKFVGLPKLYYDKKVELKKEGRLGNIQQTSQPASEPSLSVAAWGKLGAEQGLKDYARRTSRQPTSGTEADGYLRQLDWAASSAIFSWITRAVNDAIIDTRNSSCVVPEPNI